MAKDVVAVLEIVDIDERHGNGGVLLPELLEGTGKAATVAKPGKLVGKGGPDQIVLTLQKVTDGLFERFGIIAGVIHTVSGFLRSGRIASGELVVHMRCCSTPCVFPSPRLAASLGLFVGSCSRLITTE